MLRQWDDEVVKDFGFTLDQINWFGNVVNVVYLPSAIIVPYLYGRLGVCGTVSRLIFTVYHQDADLNTELHWRGPVRGLSVGALCRHRKILDKGRIVRPYHARTGDIYFCPAEGVSR